MANKNKTKNLMANKNKTKLTLARSLLFFAYLTHFIMRQVKENISLNAKNSNKLGVKILLSSEHVLVANVFAQVTLVKHNQLSWVRSAAVCCAPRGHAKAQREAGHVE
jgi:hypothetical protein